MRLLVYNPEERYSAKQAIQHEFFKEINFIQSATKKRVESEINYGVSVIKRGNNNDDSISFIKM